MDLPVANNNHEIDMVLRDFPTNVLHGTSFRVSTAIGAANSLAKTNFFDTHDFIKYTQSHIFPCFTKPREYEFVIRFHGRDESFVFISSILNILPNAKHIRLTFLDILEPFKIHVDAIISWLVVLL